MNIESRNSVILNNNKPLPVKGFKIEPEKKEIVNNTILNKDSIELSNTSKTKPFEQVNKISTQVKLLNKVEENALALEKINSCSTESEKYDLIVQTLKDNNFNKINFSPDKRNIVAFRNPNLPTENNKKGVYDDTTFVFWKDKDGNKRVDKFITNTDPNGLFVGDRPNGDFGRIKSGKTYTFGFSTSGNFGNVLRPISKLDIERFSPADGMYKDAKTSLEADKTFLFHHGADLYNKNNLYDKMNGNTYSMGCQTFPDIYDKTTKTWENTYNRFWDDLGGNEKTRQKEIFYTILNVSE